MAIIDVVKCNGNDQEFAWKFPSYDLRLGTQLVVKTAQTAYFVKGGKVLDGFEPGTYTLKNGNIPLLNKLINIPFGGDSPFQAEVWFINLISKLDNRWGTSTPIQLEDPKYKIIIPVRAFGQFGLQIGDPKLFLETLVGTMKVYTADKIVTYFKGKIISSVTSMISKKIIKDNISILEIPTLLDEISVFCEELIKDEFAKYGIEILNFYFMSINVPEDDPSVITLKKAKEKSAYINTVGKDVYSFDRSMNVMEKAADNEGNAGGMLGAGMGLGMGIGVGGNMGNQMGNISNQMNTNLNQQQNQNTQPPPPPPVIQFFILINNQQQGPFDLQSVADMIKQGNLSKETYVWKQGMASWDKAENVSELKVYFTQVPPPPPMMM